MRDQTLAGTATILRFPKERRFPLQACEPRTSPSPVIVEDGGGWYHEAAVREAETAGSA